MELMEQICKLTDELEPHMLEIRHQIHERPELAFHEFETSALVKWELERMQVPYEESPCRPGIVAVVDSGKPGKLLMLRADMDALPVQEKTGLPYASKTPGVMHACGHDVHTSNLLTVAEILNRTKDQWSGKVKLVFQPAEEHGGGGRADGGSSGRLLRASCGDGKEGNTGGVHRISDGLFRRIYINGSWKSGPFFYSGGWY